MLQEGVRVQEMFVGSASQRSHLFKRVLFGGSRFNQSFRAPPHRTAGARVIGSFRDDEMSRADELCTF